MTKEEAIRQLEQLGYEVELRERQTVKSIVKELCGLPYPEPKAWSDVWCPKLEKLADLAQEEEQLGEGLSLKRVQRRSCANDRLYLERVGDMWYIETPSMFGPATTHVYELPNAD